MVAIVAGNGLGLFNTSANILGGVGVLGQGGLGQSGGRSYVNAANGNLVLQFRDEQLSGRGTDLSDVRTYNSQGLLTSSLADGDLDGWRWDGERTIVLTGTKNTAGSTVDRTGADGHVTRFTWDGARYTNTNPTVTGISLGHEGFGADGFIEFDNATSQWKFTDGSSRLTERYSGAATAVSPARLFSQTDTSGNVITYGRDASGRLTSVVDNTKADGTGVGSGQKLVLTYGSVGNPSVTRLIKVETFELAVDATGRATTTLGTAVKQVDYAYDDLGRLTSVTTDLTPTNTTDSADPKTQFKTLYTYDGASFRVASITSGNGSVMATANSAFNVSFTYEQVGTSSVYRIKTVTDANGTQTFTYNANSTTDIKISDDAAGLLNARTWTYTYDAGTQQLTQIDAPAPTAGAARLTTQFQYDSAGNVKKIIDAVPGKAVIYQYDGNGNRLIDRDALGNTIARTYDANNQLLTETHYTAPDSSGLDESTIGIGSATGALTTRYVYDTSSRLRFMVSAEGRVTESRYGTGINDFGLLTQSIQYADIRYPVAGLADTASLTQTQLTTWVGSTPRDETQSEITQYEYDYRGNLSKQTVFSSADATGAGVLNAASTITEYIYDGHGQLLKTIAVRGAARDQKTELNILTYDGLGRELSRTDSGGTRTTVYNDAPPTGVAAGGQGSTIQVTTGTNLVITSSFDGKGKLTTVSQLGDGTTRETKYVYDDTGRLRMVQDAQGGRRFSFYDDANRLLYQVDSTGAVIGYGYNLDGQLLTQTQYQNRVSVSDWVTSATDASTPPITTYSVTKAGLTMAATDGDFAPDSARDRVTSYTYDTSGRMSSRTDAAGTQAITAYDGDSRITTQTTGDRVTRFFYDRDGKQVGVLDPLGYLTENKYDAAGRLIETVRYSVRSPSAVDVSAPVWIGVSNQTAVGGKAFSYRLNAIDADGDPLTFSVVGTPPSWLSLDTSVANAPTLKGTPPKTLTSYDVIVRADDGRGKTTDVTVHITVANTAPSWTVLPDVTVAANTLNFSLTLPIATDNEGGTLNYSIIGGNSILPTGLTFSASSRTISGTPTTPGTYVITARVTDAGTPPLATDETFVLQVTNKGPNWSVDLPPRPDAVRTKSFSYIVPAAQDPENQALNYRIVNGPAWLSITPDTHVLSGTPPLDPSLLGDKVVVLEAQDTFGETVRLAFTVKVINEPPTWPDTLPVIDVLAGSAIDYTVAAAVDPEGEAITYGFRLLSNQNALPSGLTFSAATGRISGTTSAAQVDDFQLMMSATDAQGGVVERPLTIHLRNSPPTYSHGIDNLEGWYFNWIRLSIPGDAFVDVNGDPVTLSIPGATLGFPPDDLHSTGVFFAPGGSSGTLNFRDADPADAGGALKFVTINATDARGAVTQRTISIQVDPLPPPPPPPPPPPAPPPGRPGQPPAQPLARVPGGGLPIVPSAPIERAPAPVLGLAPAPAAISQAPAPLLAQSALPPLDDVLASWRPTTDNAKDLHSYEYYDGQGRLVGSVDARGFLTETVYDAQANTQQSVRYLKSVTVAGGDTLDALRAQALQNSGASETVTTAFDSFGRLSTRTNNVDGTISRNEYDGAGRLVRQVSGDHATDHTDRQTSRTRYNAFGEVTGTLGGEGDAALLAAHPTPTQTDLDAAIANNGMRYVYDNLGRRTQASDGLGHITLYFYDSEGRLAYTVNAKGEVSQTLYNVFGQMQTQRRYGTRLDSTLLGQLQSGSKSVSDLSTALGSMPANKNAVTSYDYDQRGLLTTTTDALGFVTTNSYTAFGELATQIHTILKAAGATPVQTTTSRFDYDLRGELLLSTADAGGLNFNTRTVYDAFGRTIQSVDAAGKIATTNYSKDSGRTIEVTDAVNRMVHSEYDAFGRSLKVTDANGQSTTYSYDDVNRSVSMTTPEGVKVTTIKTRNGHTLSVIDGRTNAAGQTSPATLYTYDKDGQITKMSDALGNAVSTNTYDLKSGLLTQTQDARGVFTKFSYDAVNRLLERRVDPKSATNPTGLDLVCTYAFDAFGQQITAVCGTGSNQGANIARVTSYSFDLDGRQTQMVVDPNGLKLTTTYTYDGLGDTVQVSQGTAASPNRQVTAYVFDKLGRRVKEIAAPSAIFGAGSARARDLTTEYRYDTAGRVSRKIDANGQSTWFVYDDSGELTYTVNASGEVHQQYYDANGRVIQTRSYTTRVSTAGFVDVLNTVTVTPQSTDQRSYFVYDSDGRKRFVLQAVDAGNWLVSENRFDENGNVIEARAYDKFIPDADVVALDSNAAPGITVGEMKGELTKLKYTEQALGASSTDEKTLANIERTRFAYDANNRLRFAVDAAGGVSESVYDKASNVVLSVRYAKIPMLTAYGETDINNAVDRSNAANQITHFVYDSAGRRRYTLQTLSNDAQVLSEQTYDVLGRVTQSITYSTPLNLASFTVDDYTVDKVAGKIVANDAGDRRAGYVYDAAGRMVYGATSLGVNPQGTVQYAVSQKTYDAMGKVLKTTVYAGPVTLADFKPKTLSDAVTASDIANNVQNRATQVAYDVAGRQRFVVAADGALSETMYDALGQVTEQRKFDLVVSPSLVISEAALIGLRAARTVGDGVTRGEKYSYDLAGRILTTTDAAGFGETFTYDGLGNRSTFVDKNGVALLNQHRNDARAFDQTLVTWSYTYDRLGRRVDETSPKIDFQLSNETAPPATKRRLTNRNYYDTFGNLVQNVAALQTVDARATKYAYDKLNRQVLITLPTAMLQLSNETAPKNRTLQTQIQYDALGNVISRTQAYNTIDARATTYTYDNLGRQTMTTLPGYYDPATGSVVAPPASGGTPPTGSFQRTLETSYDTFGDAVRTKLRTGASNYQYEYKTYDTAGRIIYDVDALSHVTNFAYDVFGDQTAVTRYSVSVGAPTNSNGLWSTPDLANLKMGGTDTPLLANDQLARTVTTSYDNRGRKVLVTQPTTTDYYASSTQTDFNAINIAAVAAASTKRFDYNALGDVIHEAEQIDTIGIDRNNRAGHWRDTFRYFDAMGRATLSVDALGYQTVRTYDANGNVVQTTEYAAAGSLGILGSPTPPAAPSASNLDRITAVTYNALNQQTSIQRLGLHYMSVVNGGYVDINNDRATPTTVASLAYDSMGNVRTSIDALGNVTTLQYNALGQTTQITEPTRTTGAMSPTLQNITMTTTDASNNFVSVNVAVAIGAHTSGDPFSNQATASPVTTMTLDGFGNVVRQDRNPNDGGPTLTTLRSYDFVGNLVSTTDANTYARIAAIKATNAAMAPNLKPLPVPGSTVQYAYDYAGHLTRQTQAVNVTLNGVIQRAVNQTIEQRYLYDAVGRLTDALDVYTDAAGASQQTGAYRAYNAFGEVSAQYKEWGAANADPASLTRAVVAQYTHDNAGRIQKRLASDGEIDYFYNLTGEATRQELHSMSSLATDGQALFNTRITETAYDVLGRSAMQRLPSFGEKTQTALGGGTTLVSFGQTPFSRQSYDRWGNVVSRSQGGAVVNPLLGSPNVVTEGDTTTYDYNADNQLIAVHQPTVTAFRADTSSYQAIVSHETHYDVLGRAVLEQDFADDAGTAQHEAIQLRALPRLKQYDAAGKLVAETDATGVIQSYAYDGNGNKIGTRNALGTVFVDTFDNNGNDLSRSILRSDAGAYVSGSGQTPVAVTLNLYQYDQANRRFAELAIADNNVDWTYTQYDERNLVVARSDGTTFGLTSYSYDQLGNKTGIVDPLNRSQSWNYSYNTGDFTLGRLNHWAGGNRTTDYAYDAFGQLNQEAYSDAAKPSQASSRTYDYFENGLLQGLTDNVTAGTGVTTSDITGYSYTAKGQVSHEAFIVQATDTSGAAVVQLRRGTDTTYDALGRIQTVSTPAAQSTRSLLSSLSYNYDELGNRREILANYQPTGEAAASSDKWYTYDDEGRMTVVDGAKQGAQIVLDKTSTLVSYDALGRRYTARKYAGGNSISLPQPVVDYSDPNAVVNLTVSWQQYNTERYTYNDLNYLTQVDVKVGQREKNAAYEYTTGVIQNTPLSDQDAPNYIVTATYGYDLGGEMKSYGAYHVGFSGPDAGNAVSVLDTTTTSNYGVGGLRNQYIVNATDARKSSNATNYAYDGMGNITSYTYVVGPDTSSQVTSGYTYSYTNEFGGEKLSYISQSTSQPGITGGSTENLYDAHGNIALQTVFDAGPVTNRSSRQDGYHYDNAGRVIVQSRSSSAGGSSQSSSGTRDYFYVTGQQVAVIGTDTLAAAQFNNNYTPISAAYPASSPASYTVNANDTLAGIAQVVFGDAQLWYLIADENSLGFGPSDPLPPTEVGKTYRIPHAVSEHNNAGTFTPYNPASIFGNNIPAPWIPAPPPSLCDQVGQIVATAVVVAVAIVVTYYTAGAASGAFSSLLGSETAGGIIGASVGAAAGSVASQEAGLALGVRKDFSGREVLASALTAAATAGLGLNGSTLGGRIAQTTLGQVVDNFAGVNTGNNSMTGSQFLIDGLLTVSGISGSIDSTKFQWSTALAKVAANALDPQTGWVFNRDSRDWAKIASQALGTFEGVAIGGVIAKEQTRTQHTDSLSDTIQGSNLTRSNGYLNLTAASMADSVGPNAITSDGTASASAAALANDLSGIDAPAGISADDYLGAKNIDDGKVIHTWKTQNGTVEGTYYQRGTPNRNSNTPIDNFRYIKSDEVAPYAERNPRTGAVSYPDTPLEIDFSGAIEITVSAQEKSRINAMVALQDAITYQIQVGEAKQKLADIYNARMAPATEPWVLMSPDGVPSPPDPYTPLNPNDYSLEQLHDKVKYMGKIRALVDWKERLQAEKVQNALSSDTSTVKGKAIWAINAIDYIAEAFIPDTPEGVAATVLPVAKGLKGLSGLLPRIAEDALPPLVSKLNPVFGPPTSGLSRAASLGLPEHSFVLTHDDALTAFEAEPTLVENPSSLEVSGEIPLRNMSNPLLAEDPTIQVKGPHWGAVDGPERPALVYLDDDPNLNRLVTVDNGKAYFQSSGTSPVMLSDGSVGFKDSGQIYPFYGVQTVESSSFNFTRGSLIKWGIGEPGGTLQSVPELYNSSYSVQGITSSPEAVNAWLQQQGVSVYTSMGNYVEAVMARHR